MTAPAPQPLFQNAAGLPPNEGVPLSRWVMVPPDPPQQNTPAPADPGEWTVEEQQIVWAQIAMMLRQLFEALMDAAQAGAPAPPPPAAAIDALAFWRDDVGYFFPEKHTTIRFLASGVRPCDHPGLWTQNFEYQNLKLPSNMSVAEMVRRVGVPNRGLQEMVELVVAEQGTQFGQGQLLSREGPLAALTLEQIGWDERRTQILPIWVVLGPLNP